MNIRSRHELIHLKFDLLYPYQSDDSIFLIDIQGEFDRVNVYRIGGDATSRCFVETWTREGAYWRKERVATLPVLTFIEHLWRRFADVLKVNRICSKANLRQRVRSERSRLQEQAVGQRLPAEGRDAGSLARVRLEINPKPPQPQHPP